MNKPIYIINSPFIERSEKEIREAFEVLLNSPSPEDREELIKTFIELKENYRECIEDLTLQQKAIERLWKKIGIAKEALKFYSHRLKHAGSESNKAKEAMEKLDAV